MTPSGLVPLSGFCATTAVVLTFVGLGGLQAWWLAYLAAVAYATAAVVFGLLALVTQ